MGGPARASPPRVAFLQQLLFYHGSRFGQQGSGRRDRGAGARKPGAGENLILLPFVAFNSNVKNVLFWLYPRRSGTPGTAQFSIRSNKIPALDFLKSFHKSRSFLIIFFKATYQQIKIKKDLHYLGNSLKVPNIKI